MVVLDVLWKSFISKKGRSDRTDQMLVSGVDDIEAGEVVCLSAGRYQWTIDDFLSKVSPRSCTVYCPPFRYFDHEHFIDINIVKDKNALGLLFSTGYEVPMPRLHVTLGMNTGHSGTREDRCGETNGDSNYSVDVWMRFKDFKGRSREILSDGKLTVFCELRRLDRVEIPAALQEKPPIGEIREKGASGDLGTVSVWRIFKKLQTDLKTILDSGVGCDVTIKVDGKEFLAHSFFLQARSPVFKSMFSHEMVEKLSGVVVIDDCDPETFPDLLNYLYTGNTKHISDENVCQLFTASDKYQVLELKEECAAYMKENVSVGNFCDIVALALRHSEKELVDLSTDFFCANVGKIAKTATWQTFLHENTTAGNELFLKFLSKEKYI